MLNISVNTIDSTLYGFTHSDAYTHEQNEVESLVELVLESTNLDADAIPEGTEQEPESKQPVKKIDFYTGFRAGQPQLQYYQPVLSQVCFLKQQYTNYIGSLNSPPPEA